MSGIQILNWTYISQRSILAPVSTILLQENSFKPASSGLFFWLFLVGQIIKANRGDRLIQVNDVDALFGLLDRPQLA